ncbi:MAG: trimeric intracellular cation channel family protein [Ectothiorhodospiraceae bacterium]
MTAIHALDLFGVAVFAISGALAAGQKRLDLFGVVVLAVVTAVGGGSIRDLLLGATPVFWVQGPEYVIIAGVCGLGTVAYAAIARLPSGALPVADAVGLGAFTVLGTQKTLAMGFPPLIAVVMGVLTGVAGGMIRDLLSGEIPLILRREIYATAALSGAVVIVLLAPVTGLPVSAWVGLAATLALRLAAIRWSLALPVFTHPDTRQD